MMTLLRPDWLEFSEAESGAHNTTQAMSAKLRRVSVAGDKAATAALVFVGAVGEHLGGVKMIKSTRPRRTTAWALAALISAPRVASAQLPTIATWSSTEENPTTSVAWGDYDGDGDLDLAVGNTGLTSGWRNLVYRNDAGSLSLAWSSSETRSTSSVAWGDYDGDGDLDLAVGNWSQANSLYRNDAGDLTLVWSSSEADLTTSVAWGDYDDDGDLDLAVGNASDPNRLYRNDAGVLGLAWSSSDTAGTRSVAWGDYDDDGDLDLAVGNSGSAGEANHLYRNDGGTLTLAWSSPEEDVTYSVAWGDYDGDGDLDLAAGNIRQSNRVYRNDGGTLALAWSSTEVDDTNSVAWGDYDGDGDLDLAAGNETADRVYRNDAGALSLAWSTLGAGRTLSVAWGDYDGDGSIDLAAGKVRGFGLPARNYVFRNDGATMTPGWSSTETDGTSSIAWGDYDGDGDLDLAVGNNDFPGEANRLYRNDAGTFTLAWTSFEIARTQDVAWGDYDGDGDLDLAVGNWGEPTHLYRNDGGTLTLAWSSSETDATYSVVWGDYDDDGDLDLAVGNGDTGTISRWDPNRVYRNDLGSLVLAWTSTERDDTVSVAWGDYDSDGDLDLAVGNRGQPNQLYRNDAGSLSLSWSSTESDDTHSVAWGDYDGDADLDLAVGNSGETDLFLNDEGALRLAWTSSEVAIGASVAWGDSDGDGDLDLAVGSSAMPNLVYRNSTAGGPGLAETPLRPVALVRPGTTQSAFFFSTPEILSSPVLVPYTLVDDEGDVARQIVAEFSPNGGGLWRAATRGAGGDPTTDLAASPAGTDHTFEWDAAADGVSSDNTVFRISVLWQAPEHVGYPLQRPRLSAVTPPFRVDVPCASPTGSLGNVLLARKLSADVELSWPLALLSVDRFNVMRADADKTMLDKSALPGSYSAAVLHPGSILVGSYRDPGASPLPATAYYYEVYGRDCAGASVIP